MKVFLVKTPTRRWCQDYAMVIVAEDEEHAEAKARASSKDFRDCGEISIEEVDLTQERCVLKANTGG